MNIEKIGYFCVSVFWRASVCDWESSGEKYEAINLGAKYQEQIRQYLLSTADLPENASVTLIVSQLPRPPIVFNFPDTVRLGFCHYHTLHILGLTLQLSLSNKMEPGTIETCILRSPFHPIFVGNDGDARVQRNVLRLMGKVTPHWGQYPLANGVV